MQVRDGGLGDEEGPLCRRVERRVPVRLRYVLDGTRRESIRGGVHEEIQPADPTPEV